MHVGIDIGSLAYERGVSRYTANLVRALLDLKTAKISLYGSSWRAHKVLAAKTTEFTDRSRVVIQSYPPSLLATLWSVGSNKVADILPGIEVFHSWDWLQPPDKNLPLVSTIHDLSILKYPKTAHPKVLAMHQKSWKILKERKAHIIAVSQATKMDIVNLLEIPKNRVHVVYEALPLETVRVTEKLNDEVIASLVNQLELNRPYIFFVGTNEPRKNLKTLVEAWWPLKNDIDLIIAGESGWGDNTARKHPHLRFLGKVSEEELAILYENASVFAYPSLDEGFGLPILEAFYHGTKVLTSNRSAMKEVAGNAAELVNPESAEEIREGINRLLNEKTQEEQERVRRMVLRLHLFNWNTTAVHTNSVYRQAIRERMDV